MAQKIVLTPEECRLPTSELAQKYGISRTSAWRAAKRGWLWQAFHEKTIQQDPACGLKLMRRRSCRMLVGGPGQSSGDGLTTKGAA